MKPAADLEKQLADLVLQDRKALLESFTRVYGPPPPKRLSDSLLRLAIAYRLQESVYGGLKPVVAKSLLAGVAPTVRPSLSSGSVLVRDWHGQSHVVTVKADGVEYSGQQFRSLTEVTFRITGQKRSGPDFFGLKKGARSESRIGNRSGDRHGR